MKNILLLLLLFPFTVVAQESSIGASNWKADLNLSGFYQAGNVETKIFRAASTLSVKAYRNIFFETKNSYVFQEFGRTKADEDILSLNFLNFNPDRKLYPLALAFFSTNFRREIDLRYIIGAGLSYRVLNEANKSLQISVTTEFEHTEFGNANYNRSQYDGDATLNTYRGTFWMNGRYELVEDKLILMHESFYQPSLQESNNFRWRTNSGIAVPITEFLNITFNYQHTYESIVIAGEKKEDRFVTVGFTIKSY